MRRRSFTGRSDEQLGAEIEELEQGLRAFRRAHAGKTRDDARAAFEMRRQELRATVEHRLAKAGGDVRALPPERVAGTPGLGISLIELAAFWTVAHDEGFAKAVHAAIDAGSYSKLTAVAVAKEIGRLELEIAGRRAELERRSADREVAAARARLREAEAKLTSTAGAS